MDSFSTPTSTKQILLRALRTISVIQKPIVNVGLGLLYSYEVAPSNVSLSIVKLIFALTAMVLVLSHMMVLNDYFDVEVDKKKEDSRQALAEIPRKLVGVIAVILLGSGLLFAWLTSLTYFAICSMLVLLAVAYDVPPIRYKKVYPFSTLGEVSGAFLLFWAGYSLFATVDLNAIVSLRSIVVSLIPFLVLVIFKLKHEISHVEFDAGTGKRTLAVVHGVDRVKQLIHFCILLIVTLSLGLFLTGWISVTFLAFLVIPLIFIALVLVSSRIRFIYFVVKADGYWGLVYFFTVVALILFS
jgi:4-hydroxybenzoate polyprenyltransferase